MVLGKFSRYTPSDESRISDAELISALTGRGVIFLKDDNDVDWYDAQKKFAADTMKIAFGDDNIIRYFSIDASMLNPIDMSVGEVELSDVPEGLDILGGWCFDGVKIIRRELTKDELIAKAESKKQSLLQIATLAIAPLHDAVEMNVSTIEEEQLLIEWKKFRVLVNRIDTSLAPDINWPSTPSTL